MCVCVRLSIFIKVRVTSKGDRVSRYCELSEGGEAQGRTVWMLFKSLRRMKRFGGVLWPLCEPLGKCPQTRARGCDWLCGRDTDSSNVKCTALPKGLTIIHCPANFIVITSCLNTLKLDWYVSMTSYANNTRHESLVQCCNKQNKLIIPMKSSFTTWVVSFLNDFRVVFS